MDPARGNKAKEGKQRKETESVIKKPGNTGLFYLCGGPSATRTRDHRIKSPVLYRLS